MSVKLPKCGNPKCMASTGIHGGMTFGSGELDDYGYWERPCHLCARHFDAERANIKAAIISELTSQENDPEVVAKFVAEDLNWLNFEGWPFKHGAHA